VIGIGISILCTQFGLYIIIVVIMMMTMMMIIIITNICHKL